MASTSNPTTKRPWQGLEDDTRYPVAWDQWTYGFDYREGQFVVLQPTWVKKNAPGAGEVWVMGKPINPLQLPEFTRTATENVFKDAESNRWPLKLAVLKAVQPRRLGEDVQESIASAPDVYVEEVSNDPAVEKKAAAELLAKAKEVIGAKKAPKPQHAAILS